MDDDKQTLAEALDELDQLRQRVMELEDIEVKRITEEQERFDSLLVLDEYARQIEESRDKLTRLFRATTQVQEAKTLKDALQKIASAVYDAGWATVAVSLFDENWGVLLGAFEGLSDDQIANIESQRMASDERAQLFGTMVERFKVSRSYFIPAERLDEVMPKDSVIRGTREVRPGDEWNPLDLAYIPMYGSNGKIIGSISCDDPVDGKRPTGETFLYLELFADVAARKVENARLIEEQQEAEEALRQSEEKYRTLFKASNDGFFLMDELFRDCNMKACELWACERDDIVGHSPVEFSPEYQPDGRLSSDAAGKFIEKALAGYPQSFYWQHKRKDGSLLDCEVSLAGLRIRDEKLVLAIVRDISDRMKREEEIAAWKNRYELIVESSGQVAYDFDIVNARTLWSESVEKVFGYSLEEFTEGSVQWEALIHDEDRDYAVKQLAEYQKTLSPYDIEYRFLHKDNRYLNIHDRGFFIMDLATKGIHMLGMMADVTIQKQAELKLLQKTAEMQAIIQAFPDLYFRLDAEGVILDHHAGGESELYVSPHDFLGKRMQDVLPQSAGEKLGLALSQTLHEKTLVSVEYLLAMPFGVQTYEARFLPVMGNQVFVVIRNITERKRSEILQSVLFQISEATSVSGNLDELFRIIHEQLSRLVDTTNFFIALYDSENDLYTFPYFVDEIDDAPTGALRLSKSLTNYVRRTGMPAIVDEAEQQRLTDIGEADVVGSPSCMWLGVPLRTTHGVIGVVVVQSYHDESVYSKNDLDLLYAISGHIAMAIERKRAEERLRRAEEKYRTLVENMGEAVCMVDGDECIRFANKTAEQIFGVPHDQLVGLSLHEFTDPDQYRMMREQTSLRRAGVSSKYDIVIKRADNERRNVIITATPFLDDNGDLINVLGVLRDVTEQKSVEENLLKLKTAVEASGDVIFMTDQKGVFTYVNPEFTRLYGYTSAEVVGTCTPRILKGMKKEDIDYEIFWKTLTGKQIVTNEMQNRTKDGRLITVDASANPIVDTSGSITGYLGLQRDVTPRKRAEDTLRQTLSVLKATLDSTIEGILVVDLRGRVVSYSKRFLEMWNIPEHVAESGHDEKLVKYIVDQLRYPDLFLSRVKELYEHIEIESYDLVEFNDGRVFERHSRPQRIDSEIVGRVWSFHDITEQVRSEMAIRENEKRFRTVFEASPVGVAIMTVDGHFMEVNESLCNMLGYDKQQLLNLTFSELTHPDDLIHSFQIQSSLLSGKISSARYEKRYVRHDGSSVKVLVNKYLIRSYQGEPLYFIAQTQDLQEQVNV